MFFQEPRKAETTLKLPTCLTHGEEKQKPTENTGFGGKYYGYLFTFSVLGTWNIHRSSFATPAPWEKNEGEPCELGMDDDPYPTV